MQQQTLPLIKREYPKGGGEMKTIVEAYRDTKIGFAYYAKPIFVIIPLLSEQFLRILTGVNK